MNKMSDDLISRKEAVELVIAEYDRFQANGGSHSGRYELDKIIKILQNMQTAFDKEKVIEELQKHSHNYYPSIDHYCTSQKAVSLKDAVDIVEKGGIK